MKIKNNHANDAIFCGNMKQILSIFLISLLICSGCAWFQAKGEKSAKELANDGMAAFFDEDYTAAIESFKKLKDWYPFSKFASLAELKIADAYYHQKEYESAVFAYEEFEKLHPRNEAVPYVIYQIAMCYFERMETTDRDQTATQKSLDTFRRLIRQFPDDIYAQKSAGLIKKCEENLAAHEFYVGRFYYKSKNYKAALNRFELVLSRYPDAAIHQEVQEYISLCKKELKAE